MQSRLHLESDADGAEGIDEGGDGGGASGADEAARREHATNYGEPPPLLLDETGHAEEHECGGDVARLGARD